jgi:starch synthase
VSRDRLRILLVASEAEPFAKTGGLADVAGALPRALAALGHDVRLALPRYRGVEAAAGDLRLAAADLAVPIGDRTVVGAVFEGRLGGSVPVYFVAHDHYYQRAALYGEDGTDYLDNCERFTFFCRAALAGLPGLGWMPQVIHAHDWQTGLVPVYLETLYRAAPAYRDVASVFTIHNLAYQGLFTDQHLPLTGLGWDLFTPAGLEFYGRLSLLKGGLVFADLLTTVSPTYAREIQTPEQGEGLDGVLRERSADLAGILNGVDRAAWNPETDAALPRRYGRGDPAGKAACTAALRAELGLAAPAGRGGLLVGMVTRLADQKGPGLAAAAVPDLVAAGGQFVLVGHGEARWEREFEALAAAYPGAVAVRLGFDDGLARRVYAGADALLMPSRYEPCGIAQLIALRYGTVPVARRTGGLADTVRDVPPGGGPGTGFLFDAFTAEACREAVLRAVAVHADPAAWRRLVDQGMAEDFSWGAAAEAYVTCYRKALRKARRHA